MHPPFKKSGYGPDQVLHHGVILILPCAVISMQHDSGLSQTMMVKKVGKHADNCIGPLPNIRSLINDEVHLSGNGFIADPKQRCFPGELGSKWGQAVVGCWGSEPAE